MELAIPAWAQQITLFVIMVSSGILGLYKYFKTESDKVTPKPAPPAHDQIIPATAFLDSKLVRELIDTLREHQEEMGRQSQRLTRSQGELRESIIEVIEALHVQTNATLNMLRFMNRQDVLKQ